MIPPGREAEGTGRSCHADLQSPPMTQPSPSDVTVLLKAWADGESAALDQLIPLVYDHLRRMARRHLNNEPAGQTIQPTALVNEAYLRLLGTRHTDWQDRAHFFAISAQMMRRILVDRARAKKA